MSQERLRKLLLELDGKATIDEISNLAQERYPDETLYTYLHRRLQSMKKKDLVVKKNKKWELTESGQNTSIEYHIDELDNIVCKDDLTNLYGINIGNIVGTLRLDTQLKLDILSHNLQNADYHPEVYPSMVYKPSKELSLSILVPSSGKITIVGGKSKQELMSASRDFIESIDKFGVKVDKSSSDILIQNILAIYSLNREIDLHSLSVELGLECVEYEPEQFPGLIYRGIGTTTISIYRTGKISIMGAKTYISVVEALNDLTNILEGIGMELDLDTNFDG